MKLSPEAVASTVFMRQRFFTPMTDFDKSGGHQLLGGRAAVSRLAGAWPRRNSGLFLGRAGGGGGVENPTFLEV
jgi:hypothetical protein